MKTKEANSFYSIRIRYISILVIFGIAFISYLFPRFFNEQSELTSEDKQEIIEFIDFNNTPPEIIPPRPPHETIPVPDEDEFLDEERTTDETTNDDFDDWPPPPRIADDKKTEVKFIPYDKVPEPVGGYAELGRNVIYPEIAREAGIHGTVIIQTYIDENGKIKETIILNGMPNTGLDEAAIKAIRKTKWKPAQQRDKNVAVWVSIPIKFSLK
ncbi:MAG: energy transducer TonB [Candidatus Marinimicrobia bacterium]|jgi:protein TonB|nr:energy transducer TonB [Candidatus Neomarinimicrobiota bacterium]MBT3632952.1 energy transducer TonB [Candidatus Neomarinimicrobiota bacterium]MBT3682062.1 energy transducer TonB [Candidatus Neomarinimicrobiota bacterium]MBT3758909.1 energy transducer TonB [Candidatus Neomarinimicrobiota bacterium]MBT3895192.1 energy transducer TonB [Candidatus Neomarinimicrobiota bacterium]